MSLIQPPYGKVASYTDAICCDSVTTGAVAYFSNSLALLQAQDVGSASSATGAPSKSGDFVTFQKNMQQLLRVPMQVLNSLCLVFA